MDRNEITLQSLQDQVNDLKAEIIEMSATLSAVTKSASQSPSQVSAAGAPLTPDKVTVSPAGLSWGLVALILAYSVGAARGHYRLR